MKVGVLMGGMSSEREVSLNTGKEIVKNLDKNKYEVEPIVIDKGEDIPNKVKGIDIAFLALHGKFGEDGIIQGMLESLGIPYTGCGILSSSIGIDKDMTKRIIRCAKVKTPDWIMVKDAKNINFAKIEEIGYPVVVKPNCGGSSIATSLVKCKDDIVEAVEEALKYDKEVMIEKYIKGDEITCCILNKKMLPVIAIKPRAVFFDYTSKYDDDGADEVIVRLQKELHEKVERMALKCYEALKCSVYSRVDMIVKDGEPYVLEINTLPGMTSNSLFPKSARAAGISFSELLNLIIKYSMEERA